MYGCIYACVCMYTGPITESLIKMSYVCETIGNSSLESLVQVNTIIRKFEKMIEVLFFLICCCQFYAKIKFQVSLTNLSLTVLLFCDNSENF